MIIIESIVLGFFFLLELASLAAFGYWGFHVNAGVAAKIAIGIGAPLVVAIVWGLFLAPKASFSIVPIPARTALKLVVFLLASAALYAAGRSSLAMAMAAAAVVETALVYVLKL
ncbi:hypothetical protein SD70_17455 [Gordoniibacillus kamchatkensis]|uniref:DUF2568 domain-containing protein n=1 Tax=Gordoniibacillus kamchatkensis TaxID=1590651 RepID=A0ABR5AFM4_9BACL|nr:YrdB family protein [Paenibacillus sp. VKM B-2647]KIL39849.1 hypothetical protein SD70_17455 [Paenibacillus sp. VKM B-2647]